MAHTPEDVLTAYKEQHGIEANFGFLKDDLIVNDLFLSMPVENSPFVTVNIPHFSVSKW